MSVPIETIINNSPETANKSLQELGFYWREKDGVKLLVCKELEECGFQNGFSTRLGGVSPFPAGDLNLAGFNEDSGTNIFENRKRLLGLFEAGYSLTSVWQVHGNDVKIIRTSEEAKNTDEKFDGLVSNLPNLLAGVKTADCVPVLIGDKRKMAYAAVHAGWRGTVESIIKMAVAAMITEYGSDPNDLICAIGPSAGCKNYEVGKEVIEAFDKRFSTSGKLFKKTRTGHALIDLHLANMDQLIDCGIPRNNIYLAPFCTIERTDLFFSYRVEKKKHGKTGRLMSVIGFDAS